MMDRREALRLMGLGALAPSLLACRAGTSTEGAPRVERLRSRPPASPVTRSLAPGTTRVTPVGAAEGFLHLPPAPASDGAMPLMLLLHGAGRRADGLLQGHVAAADEFGVAVLAPLSADYTWDVISGASSGDAARIDRLLARVFELVPVQGARIGLSGFSDGGTYALALGRANGDFFRTLTAHAPGYLLPVDALGRPPVRIAHGTADEVLPIDQTSRRIVPALRAEGYTVDYREFDGPHAVHPGTMRDAFAALATG